MSTSNVTANIKYKTPARNLKAADAAFDELAGLQGEELHRQMARVGELVKTANRQNQAWVRANPGLALDPVYSCNPGKANSVGQASSPHISRRQEKSGDSARSKQITRYDPVHAGRQKTRMGGGDPGKGKTGGANLNPDAPPYQPRSHISGGGARQTRQNEYNPPPQNREQPRQEPRREQPRQEQPR